MHPDQVWVSEVTHIRPGQWFVFLAIVMDVFNRVVHGWHLFTACDTELTLAARAFSCLIYGNGRCFV